MLKNNEFCYMLAILPFRTEFQFICHFCFVCRGKINRRTKRCANEFPFQHILNLRKTGRLGKISFQIKYFMLEKTLNTQLLQNILFA